MGSDKREEILRKKEKRETRGNGENRENNKNEGKSREDWYTVEERELIQKIRMAAEEEEIPAEILPDRMERRLKQVKQRKLNLHFSFYGAVAAILVIFAGGIAIWQGLRNPNAAAENGESGSYETADKQYSTQKSEERNIINHKENVGNAYQLAKDYDEVWDKAVSSYTMYTTGALYMNGISAMEDGEGGSDGMPQASVSGDFNTGVEETSGSDDSAAADISTTNLQTEGVDESDIIKTDGNYIYQIYEKQVIIVDIRNDEMIKTAVISPELKETANVKDFYLDGDRLFLIVSEYENTLEERTVNEDAYATADCIWVPLGDYTTNIFTYDITDRSNPVLSGIYEQDGDYLTSRKAGDYIYLFSEDYMNLTASPMYDNDESYSSVNEKAEDDYNWVPQAGGTAIEPENIYLASHDYAWGYVGNCELLISSVNINEPEQSVDQLMIVDERPEIYVGNESIYLYYGNGSNTDIAKFSYKDGILDGEAAVSVDGYVRDTFAVSEKNGKLRIITTGFKNDEESHNQLYLLNEELEITGKIPDIAPGEEIYAARYIGDMAYFITYRNMDPLFVADISDESNPVLLGSLEVTGFSEYLHPFGDHLLLGIGYETDPTNGNIEGLKISMFDISNPVEPKVIAEKVLEANASAALYDYKAILVDFEKNLIAFPTAQYLMEGRRLDYKIYSWTENEFVELANVNFSMPDEEYIWEDEQYMRGNYVNNRFYVSSYHKIISLDRENGYQEIGSISLP